jgi:REP element-mobilizing transposase RayT
MSRAVRLEFPGAIYHVMNRGVARMLTFLDDRDRRDFLDRIGRWVEDGRLVVHAFCLMPNHYHLLCSTPRPGLARIMRHINGDYVRGFNPRHRRVGHLWQGRYKAILVESGRHMLECSRYIHLNPNRARMTRPAERYRWSSYRNYVGGPKAAPWVETAPTLAEFGGDRRKYRAFVEAGKGEKEVSPFERAVAGLVLGGESFASRVRKMLSGRTADRELPSLGTLRREGKATAEAVEAVVERLFAGETPRRRRRLRLYALRRHSRLGCCATADRCGRSPAAVTLAVRDLEREAKTNRSLAAGIRDLADALRS